MPREEEAEPLMPDEQRRVCLDCDSTIIGWMRSMSWYDPVCLMCYSKNVVPVEEVVDHPPAKVFDDVG